MAGTKSLREYIDKGQATVAEWVALRPIFEVCAKESGYAGGGKSWEPWWKQEAAEQQLGDTLNKIGSSKGAAVTGIRKAWRGLGRWGGSISGSDGERRGGDDFLV